MSTSSPLPVPIVARTCRCCAVDADNLTPAGINIVETVGGRNPNVQFEVSFLGIDGGQDQPPLTLGNTTQGVTHIVVDEVQQGSTGEFLANSFQPGLQSQPSMIITASGETVIAWTSGADLPPDSQDGSSDGIYAKRFDASAKRFPAMPTRFSVSSCSVHPIRVRLTH